MHATKKLLKGIALIRMSFSAIGKPRGGAEINCGISH